MPPHEILIGSNLPVPGSSAEQRRCAASLRGSAARESTRGNAARERLRDKAARETLREKAARESLRGKAALILRALPEVLTHAKGGKRYEVLPVGQVTPIICEERDLKKARKRKNTK